MDQFAFDKMKQQQLAAIQLGAQIQPTAPAHRQRGSIDFFRHDGVAAINISETLTAAEALVLESILREFLAKRLSQEPTQ